MDGDSARSTESQQGIVKFETCLVKIENTDGLVDENVDCGQDVDIDEHSVKVDKLSRDTGGASAESLAPYSDTDTKIDERQRGRKRERNPVNWKTNIRKARRLAGKSYISVAGKLVGPKELKPACSDNCRYRCKYNMDEETRKQIFNDFWLHHSWDEKKMFLNSCIMISNTKRPKPVSEKMKNRDRSIVYSFNHHGNSLRVCKTFFLNTLSICSSQVKSSIGRWSLSGDDKKFKRVKIAHNKISEDIALKIKEHIRRFPTYDCHYGNNRTNKKYLGNELNLTVMYNMYVEDCAAQNIIPCKKWFYRKVFNKDFNLSFHPPEHNTCNICYSSETKLKECKTDKLQNEQNKHLQEATSQYKLKTEDKNIAELNPKVKVVIADLQKCLPTPYLTNSQSFYLRKLWTYNYTVYDCATKKSHCMIWDETQGGRDSDEMASCLAQYLEETMNDNVEELNIWTDNCPDRNKNITMVMSYFYSLNKYRNLKIINHKFVLEGHRHMEMDAIQGIIDKKKKSLLQFMPIFTCNDWCNYVRSCSILYHVIPMTLEKFHSFSSLHHRGTPFVYKKKMIRAISVCLPTMVWMQIRREEPGLLYYKNSFNDHDFCMLDLRRKVTKPITIPNSLPLIRQSRICVSKQKYNDLMTMLQWVPDEYREYFQNIPHSTQDDDDC